MRRGSLFIFAYPEFRLLNEAEQMMDDVVALEKEVIHVTRKKPKRKSLPKDLPREFHVIADEEKVCDCCGHGLHQMSKKKSEQLEFIPAQITVIETVHPHY